MYLPAQFREASTPVLHDLIRAHPFATLVTLDAGGLVANHLPFELDAAAGPLGTLRGHVARANPVWKLRTEGAANSEAAVEALVVFQGAHHYITPSYYATKAATGKVVPTWNYAVVHAHGPLRAIEDPAWLRGFVEQLTARYEAARAQATGAAPWHVSDAPEPFLETMLKAIVGIELPIARLEGKWKVSQNRPAEDRAGVVAGLGEEPGELAQAMAALVRERSQG
ncbi:MAG TPA: FMN-binding negative transcriptional regulator [Kofleriaceae bacterium]|nr:FMN-binding negative transcriptional regulator [Kofleriaceae bacterium]